MQIAIKMPECRSPASFQQICLKAVGGKMDFWCREFSDNFQVMKGFKYFIGPFDNISSDVCKLLLELLMERGNLKRPYLYLLINHSLVDLDLSGCPLLVKDDIINVALLRCKGLKSINLSNCIQVKKMTLVALAEAYPNLVSLNLHGTKCAQEAARAVFKNCTKVKDLILSSCMLDDDDLSVLIDSVKNKGTHKNLRRFCLYSTEVSCQGLALVLHSLPWVTLLEHQSLLKCLSAVNDELIQARHGGCEAGQDSCEAGQDSCEAGQDTTLKLRSLIIHEHAFTSSRMLGNCFKLCPQLVKVEIVGVDGYDNRCFREMGNLAMLRDLKIGCNRQYDVHFIGLLQALEKIGSNLQQLVLEDIEGLNPLKIAQLCPNLIELYLTIYDPDITFHCQLDNDCPSPEILPKLRKLTLGGNGSGTEDITQPGLTRFLSACCVVEKLTLVQLEELTDTVLQDLLTVNELSHLTSLEMYACRHITNESLGELILSPTNKLRLVKIMDCWNITRKDYSNWLATAKEKNYSLEIDWK